MPSNGNTDALSEIVVKLLKTVEQNMSFYFRVIFILYFYLSAPNECLDWVRESYSSASHGRDTTLQEQEELTEWRPNHSLNLRFADLGQFVVGKCLKVPHSGKQIYFDIAPISHDRSV